MDLKRKVIMASFAFFLFFTAFLPEDDSIQRIDMGKIENDLLSEASGLAASTKNPGVLWIHNDSGDTNRIFAMSVTGRHLGIYYLDDVEARDWEDIAVAPGPMKGKSYIYVADIGDNEAKYLMKRIYRFEEPKVDTSQTAVDTVLASIDVITFRYPDGKRDAEGLMVDPLSNDIYIVSKREQQSRLYMLPFPQSVSDTLTAEFLTQLPFRNVTACDISPNGDGILIKNYKHVYYWKRDPQLSVVEVVQNPPVKLPYIIESQGEAICWSPDGRGYYTTSEENGEEAHIYYYPFDDSKIKSQEESP
jgi:hypothetical protein